MIGDENTASIAQFINRGSNYIFPYRKSKLAMFYLLLNYYPSVKKRLIRANSVITQKLIKVFKTPRRFFSNSEPPNISLIGFNSSDF